MAEIPICAVCKSNKHVTSNGGLGVGVGIGAGYVVGAAALLLLTGGLIALPGAIAGAALGGVTGNAIDKSKKRRTFFCSYDGNRWEATVG